MAFSLLVCCESVWASLIDDRRAIERVYYSHRLGRQLPFDEVLPPATLDHLVRLDVRKEAALRKVYGVDITPAMLTAEVQRIDATTRAPEMLAEIKRALGNDPVRFANAFARPIVVERLLRDRFDHDDSLHAPQRQQTEATRTALIAARQRGADYSALRALMKRRHPDAVTETEWQLGTRPADTQATGADDIDIRRRFGPNARVLSPGPSRKDAPLFFEDLPSELQQVLRAQLRASGDISAVIETPAGFLLYVAKQKTDSVLSVAGISLPKRSYDQWLEQFHE